MNKKLNKIALKLQGVLQSHGITQKEMIGIIQVKTQSGVSDKFTSGNITVDEIFNLSEKYQIDFFYELSQMLSKEYRNIYGNKELMSPIEKAILSLVRNNIK